MMGSAEAFFFFRMMDSAEAESCVDEMGFFFRMMKMGSTEAQRVVLMKWDFSSFG